MSNSELQPRDQQVERAGSREDLIKTLRAHLGNEPGKVKVGAIAVMAADLYDLLDAFSQAEGRIKELEEALRPFAAIKPSSFFAADGSEREGYRAICSAAPHPVDFTGGDLARARQLMTKENP